MFSPSFKPKLFFTIKNDINSFPINLKPLISRYFSPSVSISHSHPFMSFFLVIHNRLSFLPNAAAESYVLLRPALSTVFPCICAAAYNYPDPTGFQIRQAPHPVVPAGIVCFLPAKQVLAILHNIPHCTSCTFRPVKTSLR